MASGVYGVGENGLTPGSSAVDVLTLVAGSKPWTPGSKASILAVESSSTDYSVIYSTGSGNRKVFSSLTFNLVTGQGTGKPAVLSAAQVLAKEESLGVDLNGDAVIGDGILGVAQLLATIPASAGVESASAFGHLAANSPEPGYAYPSGVASAGAGDTDLAVIAEQDMLQAGWVYS